MKTWKFFCLKIHLLVIVCCFCDPLLSFKPLQCNRKTHLAKNSWPKTKDIDIVQGHCGRLLWGTGQRNLACFYEAQ